MEKKPLNTADTTIDAQKKKDSIDLQNFIDTFNTVKATDYNFLADSIFHGHKALLKYYVNKYFIDTCVAERFPKDDIKEEFEGLMYIGKIRNNKIRDSVFVLNPLSYCDSDGQCYYFTDTSLPRLQTDSYCCHPENIFLVGDIDEDGVSEIGQYTSSCASHYKALLVWTLKNNEWKQVGSSVFDQHYMTYDLPYSTYVKKISKGKFEMLEITDLTDDSTKIGKRNWRKFSM
jgi:hypothetical protein